MAASTPDRNRKLLPRWRSAADSAASGELSAATPVQRFFDSASPEFEALKLEWARDRSVEAAAELVATSVVLGRIAEVSEALTIVARAGSDVTPELRQTARALLGSAHIPEETIPKEGFAFNRLRIHQRISSLRRRVRSYPRNAIAWMELARAYTILGQTAPALNAVTLALNLAPTNRFVLRTASRFFVHIGDPEAGLFYLRKSRSTRTDPWLLSADIALSQLTGRLSPFLKKALALSDADRVSPWHMSELNGALATVKMVEGSSRIAGKLFRKSIEDPTENALAQAQWAASGTLSLTIPDELLNRPYSYEANALRSRAAGNWSAALEACRQWSVLEPTSIRPLILGSFIASAALENGSSTLEFADRALVTEPASPIALNNRAVALAYLGRLVEAEATLEQISGAVAEEGAENAVLATRGLIAYRSGAISDGRQLYIAAANRASAAHNLTQQALVIWHLLREEVRSGSEEAQTLAAALWKRSKSLARAMPEIQAIAEGIAGKDLKANARPRILTPAGQDISTAIVLLDSSLRNS